MNEEKLVDYSWTLIGAMIDLLITNASELEDIGISFNDIARIHSTSIVAFLANIIKKADNPELALNDAIQMLRSVVYAPSEDE